MSTPIEYASFIIRIWRKTGQNAQGNPYNWQSEVEHIQSGKTWTFDTLEDLQAFNRQQMEHPEELVSLEVLPASESGR